jgi:hypothetical protein
MEARRWQLSVARLGFPGGRWATRTSEKADDETNGLTEADAPSTPDRTEHGGWDGSVTEPVGATIRSTVDLGRPRPVAEATIAAGPVGQDGGPRMP